MERRTYVQNGVCATVHFGIRVQEHRDVFLRPYRWKLRTHPTSWNKSLGVLEFSDFGQGVFRSWKILRHRAPCNVLKYIIWCRKLIFVITLCVRTGSSLFFSPIRQHRPGSPKISYRWSQSQHQCAMAHKHSRYPIFVWLYDPRCLLHSLVTSPRQKSGSQRHW